jgi:hypothetical protein
MSYNLRATNSATSCFEPIASVTSIETRWVLEAAVEETASRASDRASIRGSESYHTPAWQADPHLSNITGVDKAERGGMFPSSLVALKNVVTVWFSFDHHQRPAGCSPSACRSFYQKSLWNMSEVAGLTTGPAVTLPRGHVSDGSCCLGLASPYVVPGHEPPLGLAPYYVTDENVGRECVRWVAMCGVRCG